MRFALSTLILAGALSVETFDETTVRPSREQRQSDSQWERVLDLAKAGNPGSKKELQAKTTSDEGASSLLAKRILALWNEADNTYYSEVPRPLETTCIRKEELEKLPPDDTNFGMVAVSVEVSPVGLPTDLQIVSGPPNAALRKAVLAGVRRMLFVPAKKGSQYVRATVTITCRQEPVR